MNHKTLFFLLCGVALLLGGCASTQVIKPEENLDSRVVQEYEALEKKALTSRNPEKVLPEIDRFIRKYSDPAWVARGYNTKGLVYYRVKDWSLAEGFFKRALDASTVPYLSALIRINLATTRFYLNNFSSCYETLTPVEEKLLSHSNLKKLHSLRLRSALRTGKIRPAVSAYGSLYTLEENGAKEDASKFTDLVKDAFDLRLNLEEQQEVAPFLRKTPLGGKALFSVGRRLFENGDKEKAERFLNWALEEDPQGPIGLASTSLLSQLKQVASEADPLTIGVCIPLSGSFARFGEQVIKGLNQALHLIGEHSAVQLVFEDSLGEPEEGALAIDSLVYEHKAIAVIGGLVTKSAEAQAKRAKELGIPYVSLSQKELKAFGGEWAFQVGMTQKDQVKNVMQFAVEKLGIREFALMHSDESWAVHFADVFWQEAKDRDLTVKGINIYPGGQTDFREEVRSLVGLKYEEARSIEKQEREAYVAQVREEDPKAFRRGKSPADLPPIIDFNGVFVPEFPKTAVQIIPTFAYEDVKPVRFIGINTWNTNLFLKRVGNYAESAVFPDAFYPEDPRPLVRQFVSTYKDLYGEDPDVIAAQAYDAGNLITQAMKNAPSTRSAMRNAIEDLRVVDGVSGVIHTTGQGGIYKDLYIFMIQNGKAIPIKAPSATL